MCETQMALCSVPLLLEINPAAVWRTAAVRELSVQGQGATQWTTDGTARQRPSVDRDSSLRFLKNLQPRTHRR